MTTVINLRHIGLVTLAKEEGTYVRIDRATVWGNPYHIGKDGTREEVIRKYKKLVESSPETLEAIKKQLKDKKLACWCSPLACHGDILARIANEA